MTYTPADRRKALAKSILKDIVSYTWPFVTILMLVLTLGYIGGLERADEQAMANGQSYEVRIVCGNGMTRAEDNTCVPASFYGN